MRGSSRGQPLLFAVGALTWAVAALPVATAGARNPAHLGEPRILGWGVAFALFGLVYLSDGWRSTRRSGSGRVARLMVEAGATVAMTALVPSPFSATPLVVVASQLAGAVPALAGWAWIALQSLAVLVALVPGGSLPLAVTSASAYLLFQLFAYHTASVAAREVEAREALERANAELRATQELLAESSRLAERSRIAGEIHDVLGHHLTALSLNLEAALHLDREPAREHLERARTVARLLLSDVRGVAGELREDGAINVAEALTALVDGVPRPRVVATIPRDLRVEEAACAQALLRCVQEAVTNAMRHSDAEVLVLTVEPRDGGVAVSAHDDGRGASPLVPGGGLTGMRARLEAVGGWLDVRSAAGAGLALRAWVPNRRPPR
ncbi:MAG TPA: histidine kinase [Thermoanaerobaculia bacterium]|jgi:signal transduction histidine kinase|nr:histidine kinase [Thermoanaerobaculia bacterium]